MTLEGWPIILAGPQGGIDVSLGCGEVIVTWPRALCVVGTQTFFWSAVSPKEGHVCGKGSMGH